MSCTLTSPSSSLSPRQLAYYYHSRFLPSIEDFKFRNCSSKFNLNILHHNARSICNKITGYSTLPSIKQTDILCISETFLSSHVPNSHVNLPGFNLERCDRPKSSTKGTGGGAAIFISDKLSYNRLPNLTHQTSL